MKNAEMMLKKSKFMMDDSYKTLQMAFTNLKKIQNEESRIEFAEQEKATQKQQQAMKVQEKAIVKEKDEMKKMEKIQKVFHKSLVDDKLIGIDDEPSMLLSHKEFIAGGKKQSRKMQDKYLILYKKLNGHALEKGKSYAMNYKIK
nr:hypothetical protein [Bacteroidota bacterium]